MTLKRLLLLLVLCILAKAQPALTGIGISNPAGANLATLGNGDWIKWGNSSLLRKSGGGSIISTYSLVGSGSVSNYTNDPRTIAWSGGTPTASGSDTFGISITGHGNGFSFTSPAGTSPYVLTVLVGGSGSGGKLTATLSDSSASPYADTIVSSGGQYDRAYTLSYEAASSSQSLAITWVQNSGTGSVTMQAAALATAVLPMMITTTSVPNGTVGTAYSQTVGVTGGTAPYSWSVVAPGTGNLPTSITLAGSTGVLSGTPTIPNAHPFTAQVTDSASHTATQALAITVLPAAGSTYYVSSAAGSDSNSGLTTSLPFQTLGKCQSSMRAGTPKTCTARAGTYTLGTTTAGSVTFTSSDNGEDWVNYPGEAPVIDGGSSSGVGGYQFIMSGVTGLTFTGLTFRNYPSATYMCGGAGQVGDFVCGGTNVTWNYNTFSNCIDYCIMTTNTSGTTITNNTFTGQTGGDQGPFGDTFVIDLTTPTSALIQHNTFTGLGGGAVGFAAPMGNNNTIDSNYINGANSGPFTYGDIGAINTDDADGSPHTSTGNQITNNVILNNGPSSYTSLQVKSIYLDDYSSNTTVTGNICQHCGTFALQIHGGDHNTVENNIFDLSAASTAMVLYQGEGGGTDYGMAGNLFERNIIYATENVATCCTCCSSTGIVLWDSGITGSDANPTVQNNLYYTTGGGTWPNTGSVNYANGITDTSPVYQNPLFANPSGANYTMPGTSPSFTVLSPAFTALATNQGPLPLP